jgi:hypothetical protein
MMAIRERNPGALQRLRVRARRLDSPAFRGELSQVLGATSVAELTSGFLEQRDPYGNPWQKLTSRDGEALRNNGLMLASAHADQMPGGSKLIVDQGHPKTHNYGATIVPVAARALRFMVRGAVAFAQRVVIPKRQMVPDRAKGLGLWGRAFRRDASDLVRRTMGRAV